MRSDAVVKVSFSRLITLSVANLRHQYLLTHSTKLVPERLGFLSIYLYTTVTSVLLSGFYFSSVGSAAEKQERKPAAGDI